MMWQWISQRRPSSPPSGGYENSSLIDVVVRKTRALSNAPRIDDVVPGEALLPTLSAVAIAAKSGPVRVLDFGGAAGLHYLAAKQIFPDRQFRWAVIETTEMTKAVAPFITAELRYFTRLEDGANWLEQVDLMHCVSALQYVSEPETTLAQLIALQAKTMLWAKLMLGQRRERFAQTSRLRDNGPGPLPAGINDRPVTYTATRMPKIDFLAAHQRAGYRLAWKASESDSFLFLAPSVG
jgi:putative methyltransferase (TIGR04325 family)